ncbi:hypothetical protein AB0K92_10800 [Streptomyces sp. NPDC052687]|uniref:hypothetical protein n=1 Tax=Streptomyces sp. NPDC052687 TaxID=3154759 RepID=UPI003426E378
MEHARLTVTLQLGHGTLARLAATLNNHHVLGLAYTTASPGPATAVVHVPRPDAPRAQQKLRRLVDVIDVSLELGSAGTAETPGPPSPAIGAAPPAHGPTDALSDGAASRADVVTLSPGP